MTGCAGDDGSDPSPVGGAVVPDGFVVETVAAGLDRPTQLAIADDGRWVVAQLAGDERDGTGQVLGLDPAAPDDRTVLAEGLDVPTGVAVVDDQLWIMERRRLTVGPIDRDDRSIVADDLEFNGRSEGSLTVFDGRVVFDTSGRQRDGEVVATSGMLWAVGTDGEWVPLATGLKHGYAHAVDGDRLWVTEIGDGTFDGVVPRDELNVLDVTALSRSTDPTDPANARPEPVDFGWPRCIDDRQPVAEFGATAATCARTARPHALFAPRATPTSVVVAPWDDDTLLVALWNEGLVVSVPTTPGETPHEPTTFLTGIAHPQHLVVDGDRVLLVDHDGGRLLAIHKDT